ncbi:MAG: glycosyltransferase family 4 protein [Victivallaceae bacterium]|nr:glycosyltransferase family 4 protein [Victivallaceae bacterium]
MNNGGGQKILFWVRQDYYSHPGGDSAQAENLKIAFEANGITVDISCDINISLTQYAWVAIWHLERIHDSWYYWKKAKLAGKKIILADTYWPFPEDLPLTSRRHHWRETGKNIMRLLCFWKNYGKRTMLLHAIRRGYGHALDDLLNGVACHLVNSNAEKLPVRRICRKDVHVHVVHNICNLSPSAAGSLLSGRCYDLICVGHFCPRKNQLFLIKALKKTHLQIQFCGGHRPSHRRYYKKCRAMAAGQHIFHDKVETETVHTLLRQARVHICVSNSETPGIGNLEAMAAGCKLVLPDIQPVKEYFQDNAFYFTVNDEKSLLEAIYMALNDKQPHLPRTVTSQEMMNDEIKELLNLLNSRCSYEKVFVKSQTAFK